MRKAAALLFAMALVAGIEARADNIIFACAGTKDCKDSIKQSGTNYSTIGDGIQVFDVLGPYDSNAPFELAFDTAKDTISIDGTKRKNGKNGYPDYTGQDLVGTITGLSATPGIGTTALAFAVSWPTLPKDVQTWLGSATGTGSVTIIEDTKPKTGKVESASVVITPLSEGGSSPVPEPASLFLFGSGLAAVCGAAWASSHLWGAYGVIQSIPSIDLQVDWRYVLFGGLALVAILGIRSYLAERDEARREMASRRRDAGKL